MLGIQPISSRSVGVNHAWQQRCRRLTHAGRLGLAGTVVAVFGVLAVMGGVVLPGALLLVVAVMVGLRARHWLSLAERSRIGARSEDEVRCVLARLEHDGWRLRHGVRRQRGGDVDSVAIAPARIGFAIETKTRNYDGAQLADGSGLEPTRPIPALATAIPPAAAASTAIHALAGRRGSDRRSAPGCRLAERPAGSFG